MNDFPYFCNHAECSTHVFARPSVLLDFIPSRSSHRSKRYHVQLIKSGSLATLNTKQLLHNCGKFLLSTLFKHLLSVLNDFQGSQPNCSFETISIFHAPVTPSVTWGAKLAQWISKRNMNSSCLQNIWRLFTHDLLEFCCVLRLGGIWEGKRQKDTGSARYDPAITLDCLTNNRSSASLKS